MVPPLQLCMPAAPRVARTVRTVYCNSGLMFCNQGKCSRGELHSRHMTIPLQEFDKRGGGVVAEHVIVHCDVSFEHGALTTAKVTPPRTHSEIYSSSGTQSRF